MNDTSPLRAIRIHAFALLLFTAPLATLMAAEPPAVPLAAPAIAPAEKPLPLYARIGGVYGLADLVDEFVDNLWDDAVLRANPELKAARKRLPKAAIKFHIASVLCHAAGGPCEFTAIGGAPEGTNLGIGPQEWSAITGDFKRAMREKKIKPPEQEELLGLLERSKPMIAPTANDFGLG